MQDQTAISQPTPTSPHISWPASDGLSPLKARAYTAIQHGWTLAEEHVPAGVLGFYSGLVKGYPQLERVYPMLRTLLAKVAPLPEQIPACPPALSEMGARIHSGLLDASEEQIRHGLGLVLQICHSILDDAPDTAEESAPDGSSHDGATNEEPAA